LPERRLVLLEERGRMEPHGPLGDPAGWLTSVIGDFIGQSPENSLHNETNEKAWQQPIVGFSSGEDPLYDWFQRDIGDFYWTPLEIFAKTFPHVNLSATQLTVVSWALPQTEQTKSDNRKETRYPSERWARSRVYGERANLALRRHVVAMVRETGHHAVAPMLSPLWERKISERYGFASTWSERHTAYAAGLGTFGLCDGLITPLGKAVRVGSLVTDLLVTPSERPYENHHAYCIFYTKGLCGKCIDRCPAGAVTRRGHDKERCKRYTRQVVAPHVNSAYGMEGYSCGLCQTDVPCESKIPTEFDVQ
jgi:epoxyqueuosine reductase QueG